MILFELYRAGAHCHRFCMAQVLGLGCEVLDRFLNGGLHQVCVVDLRFVCASDELSFENAVSRAFLSSHDFQGCNSKLPCLLDLGDYRNCGRGWRWEDAICVAGAASGFQYLPFTMHLSQISCDQNYVGVSCFGVHYIGSTTCGTWRPQWSRIFSFDGRFACLFELRCLFIS